MYIEKCIDEATFGVIVQFEALKVKENKNVLGQPIFQSKT